MNVSFAVLADSKTKLYTSVSVFLFGSLSLAVPSGYSLGAVLFLLGGLALPVLKPGLSLSPRHGSVAQYLTFGQ